MGSIADKLQKTLDSKAAIKAAIDSKGIDAGNVLSDYSSKIEEIGEWSPNSTWWDIESIIMDSSHNMYANRIIQLIPDSGTTSFIKGGIRVELSDGSVYDRSDGNYPEEGITHTWDTSKDKPCLIDGKEVYKTRWIITHYVVGTDSIEDVDQSCLYLVIKAMKPNNIVLGKMGYSVSKPLLQGLKFADGASFENIINADYLFGYCPSLRSVPDINLPNAIQAKYVIAYNFLIKPRVVLDYSKISDYTGLFFGSNIDRIEVSVSVNSLNSIFGNCFKLFDLDLGDVSSVSDWTNTFLNDCSLVNLKMLNFKGSETSSQRLSLVNCISLSRESIMSIFENAASDLYPNTLVSLGATNLAKLSAEDIAFIESKGFDVTTQVTSLDYE